MAEVLKAASIFSPKYPTLRLVWDATSLNALMKDPLAYYWRYVEGWRNPAPSIDLLWGKAWDKCMAYYHSKRTRMVHDDSAIELTVWFAINYAQKIGLDEVAAEAPKDKGRKKCLATLIRALVWYDAEFGSYELYRPVMTEPRQAKQWLGINAPCGNPYVMVGNYDEVVQETHSESRLVVERKSTTQTPGPWYWLDYDPSVQVNTYDWLAAQSEKISGVLLEAVQCGIGFARFAHHPVYRTGQQRAHWLQTMQFWVKFAEQIAMAGDWDVAMNLATQRWDSIPRNIERRSPAVWQGLLRTELQKAEPWNPLEDA